VRSLSIYDGTTHVGTIKVDADGNVFAFDRDGKRLGLFKSLPAAQAAFHTTQTADRMVRVAV
jgi:hypothetical protein